MTRITRGAVRCSSAEVPAGIGLRVRLGISDTRAAALARIQDHLMRAELSECDIWYQQDIRVASLMVAMAEEGRRPSYEKAFVQLFGKHPNQITSWWGNRRILLRLAEECNRPTPLLCANRVKEVLEVIPDYDPSIEQVGRKAAGLTWRGARMR